MERDDTVYTTRRKANYTLSDGRQYWKAGQVLQCVDGGFCKPMPEEMVDRGVPFGPKYVALEQLADQARSIRPTLKHVRAMRQREELDAAGRSRSLQEVKAELTERQAEVDAELTKLLQDLPRETTDGTGEDLALVTVSLSIKRMTRKHPRLGGGIHRGVNPARIRRRPGGVTRPQTAPPSLLLKEPYKYTYRACQE